ncbi:hypothetical protein MASR1M59_29030 [Melaminivora sp.]
MSEPTTSAAPAKLLPMQTMAVGRIEATERRANSRYTRVICPAEDRYTPPQVVEIRSKGQSLGNVGEEIRVLCKLGGYKRKAISFTDKETGEMRHGVPVVMTLDLVD